MIRFSAFIAIVSMATPVEAALKVVTTMPDYAAIAKEVGGEHVTVTSLSKATQDPHFVDAKPSYVMELNRADLVITNGLELEIGWMPTLLVQARNPRATVGAVGYLDVGTVVERVLDVPVGNIDRSMGDVHPGGNPHYSHDPVRMIKVIEEVAERLSLLVPAHRSSFEANSRKLQADLQKHIQSAQADFQALPEASRRVVEYHKSWVYLFETLGVEVTRRIEPKPGISPTPGHVAKVVSYMKRENIRVVVQENYAPVKVNQTIAKITGSTHVILPAGTKFDDGESYLDHIKLTIQTLYDACKAGGS